MSRPAGTEGYAAAAAVLAEQYESVTFEQVHRNVLHLFPGRPATILDVGAGTGRDAAALARQGHAVVAAEPTAELRLHGQRIHQGEGIEWVDDALPDLPVLRRRGARYDMILLIGVWMHLSEEERATAMATIAGLLAARGRVIMSLRHGPPPAKRRMFIVSAAETIALADRFGLAAIHCSTQEDGLSRADVYWSFLGLEAAAPQRSVPRREGTGASGAGA